MIQCEWCGRLNGEPALDMRARDDSGVIVLDVPSVTLCVVCAFFLVGEGLDLDMARQAASALIARQRRAS